MVDYKKVETKAKEIAKENNIDYYELLQRFMFERILERISVSKYNDNFILKGGLLLSAMFGVDNRTTKDMDTTIKGLNIDTKDMTNTLNEILAINLNDGVKFDIVDITDIRQEDEYGGNRYHVTGRLQNMKVNLEIDISTGDTITPKELKYKYHLIFSNKDILISCYNIETILSEKIETILSRGIYNSRMKDYYDIYKFINDFEINLENFNLAMKTTFIKRNSIKVLEDYENILKEIKVNERINSLWNNYRNKKNYAKEINLNDIIDTLNIFLEKHHILVY